MMAPNGRKLKAASWDIFVGVERQMIREERCLCGRC